MRRSTRHWSAGARDLLYLSIVNSSRTQVVTPAIVNVMEGQVARELVAVGKISKRGTMEMTISSSRDWSTDDLIDEVDEDLERKIRLESKDD